MMTEQQLDDYRQQGTKVRIVRDSLEVNDVIGIVVAWDETTVLIRRHNRRVVKISRQYTIQPFAAERFVPTDEIAPH